MAHAAILAARIKTVIEAHCIDNTTEASAHDAIEAALQAEGLEPKREVALSSVDRVDLMCGSVAIEVKSARRVSRRDTFRQLRRYAEHDAVQAIVLATGRGFAAVAKINDKPLVIASLSAGWL